MSNAYTTESIQVLTGLEGIRKRPGMYIRSTETAQRDILFELLDQACAFAESFVRVSFDGSRVELEDDSRGIPTEQEVLQQIVGSLCAGGAFRRRTLPPTY